MLVMLEFLAENYYFEPLNLDVGEAHATALK